MNFMTVEERIRAVKDVKRKVPIMLSIMSAVACDVEIYDRLDAEFKIGQPLIQAATARLRLGRINRTQLN